MTYLVLKMFAYLAFAAGLGFGAGWLLRNLAAAGREEELQKDLNEARARVPQIESQLRSRDEKVSRLEGKINGLNDELVTSAQTIGAQEQEVRDKDREVKALETRNRALQGGGELAGIENTVGTGLGNVSAVLEDGDVYAATGQIDQQAPDAPWQEELAEKQKRIAELETDVTRLNSELRSAQTAALIGSQDTMLENDIKELEARLRTKATEYEALRKSLDQEKRKVSELEQERELQNRSLQLLHTQLEVERERPNTTEQVSSS